MSTRKGKKQPQAPPADEHEYRRALISAVIAGLIREAIEFIWREALR